MTEQQREHLWECPSCHQRVTNTMLQSATLNFRCRGTFGSYPRIVQCSNTLGDYRLVLPITNKKDECQVSPVSSRVCELGTKCCTVYHQRSE
jgi:hypothetical protein